jgi:hypothetical protein
LKKGKVHKCKDIQRIIQTGNPKQNTTKIKNSLSRYSQLQYNHLAKYSTTSRIATNSLVYQAFERKQKIQFLLNSINFELNKAKKAKLVKKLRLLTQN